MLLVENRAAEALLIEQTLAGSVHPSFAVARVSTLNACLRRLHRHRFDAVLLDLDLPDSKGLAALPAVLAAAGDAPVVVLVEPGEEPLATGAVEAGARDYLVKRQILGSMLVRAICRACERAVEEVPRNAATQLRFQAALLDAVGDAVVAMDLEGRIIYWNHRAECLSGWKAEEVMGRAAWDVIATPEAFETIAQLPELVTGGEAWAGELSLARRDRSAVAAFVSGAPIRNEAGAVVGMVLTATDLTEVKRLEQQLQQAQRMEAVGRLAGGIAHDFNNILTSIQGSTYFLLEELRPSDARWGDAEQIRIAAERAAALTRQLLALSRKQVLQPRLFDLGSVVAGMEQMLARVIGEDIELVFSRDPQLGMVKADPGQIEQVVMNLAVNARDAMPQGGRLEIELRNVDGPHSQGPGGAAGDAWVRLRVRDTGTGIPADVLPHIFEPFFTTKALGQGTGLGLSTVYGIITQSGGRIEVRSEPGAGTAFEIDLPRVDLDVEAPTLPLPREPASGGQTILFVEDEEGVRMLGVRTLRRLGYQVLAARNGAEALVISARHPGPIDLLLTDVVLPQMSGRELAEHLTALRPGLRVLYISGYTADILGRHGVMEAGQLLLEKPFSPSQLAARVAEVLSAPTAARA